MPKATVTSSYNMRPRKTAAQKEAEKEAKAKKKEEEKEAAALRAEQRKKERAEERKKKREEREAGKEVEKEKKKKEKKKKAAPEPKKKALPKGEENLGPLVDERRGDFLREWPMVARKHSVGLGLINPSNYCYRNSSLQVLMHLPPLLHFLFAHNAGNDCAQQSENDCLPCQLRALAVQFWQGRRGTTTILNRILKAGSVDIVGEQEGWPNDQEQHDTTEYTTWVLNRLRLDLPPDDEQRSTLDRLFRIGFGSTTTCRSCGAISTAPVEEALELALFFTDDYIDDPTPYPLADIVEGYFSPQVAENYRCGACDTRGDADHRELVQHAPPLLIVVLKRYRFIDDEPVKITDDVNCEADLDLGPYLTQGVPGGGLYELRGFVSHSPVNPQSPTQKQGSAKKVSVTGGHYWAGVQGPDGTWSIMEDNVINDPAHKRFGLTKHEALYFQPRWQATPYLLVFQRRPAPVKTTQTAVKTTKPKRPLPGGFVEEAEWEESDRPTKSARVN
ncbi:MAG: hypothetical protein M1823_004446 [Watsoniomyces obsoletus]|nr:MAG: hypothetical protein M1823_004446 [Watsoniomyces obsoletus]